MAEPRVLTPFTPLTGPMAVEKDFSMTPQRVDHRHPAVAAPETVEQPEDIAPDAEPVPTPATPTPRPDGQPPAPDAVAAVVPVEASSADVIPLRVSEG